MPVRILLADDHSLVRQGFKSLLERGGFQVVAEASDGHEAADLAKELRPDIAILDIGMPHLNGVDGTAELLKASPKSKVIVLTQYEDEKYVTAALRAGARGYVLKTQAPAELVQAINLVGRGGIYLSPRISRVVVEAYLTKSEAPAEPLTSRERQVLQLITEGKSSKEIATLLTVSAKTVESHRTRLMRKLDIHEVATLVRYAIRRGLVEP